MIQEATSPVVIALLAVITGLMSLLAWMFKKRDDSAANSATLLKIELVRVRDALHDLRDAIFEALLCFTVVDERFKDKIREDLNRSKKERKGNG